MSRPATENLTIVQGETFDRAIRLCSYLRSVNDANMAAGSTTLTAFSGNFSALDVGRRVLVSGAGTNGGTLDTSIVSITSTTSIVLAAPAVAATSKTLASVYTPVVLTGWTIKSQIRESETATAVLAEFSITRDDTKGRITRALPAADSASLPAIKAWHDLRMIDAGLLVRVWTRGRLNILHRITV